MQRIENDRQENIAKYASFGLSGTSWLGFRDIPSLIEKHVKGPRRVLDFGCGAGRSTRYLRSLGLNAIGMDISKAALSQAKLLDSETFYIEIQNGKIPAVDGFFDFVFSSYVLLVLSSKESMLGIVSEMERVLSENGILLIITGSEELHSPKRDWLSYDVSFPENESLESGALCKVKNKEVGAEFYDTHWTDSDYREVFEKAGLEVIESHRPLGLPKDGYPWLSESEVSPHQIYVLKRATHPSS